MVSLSSLLCCAAVLCGAARADDETWQRKLDPTLLDVGRIDKVEFIVVLGQQLRVAAENDRGLRTRGVVRRLRRQATETQPPLLAQLDALGATYRSFWVANLIWVRGDGQALEAMARRTEVARIDANPLQRQARPPSSSAATVPAGVEWNVNRVGADAVWALGYDGSGVVIGSQDTGFFWEHPALRSSYRGWDGNTVNHAHNWHDAIHVDTLTSPTCPANSPEPCDDGLLFPHGTYTMGIAVGDDGTTNRIGVSPGARWIGCRNSDLLGGTPATYIECFEWLLAPTDADDLNPDPTKAPHVINNSWACIPGEGCNPNTLQMVVDNVRAAGIVVVAAAGNDGAECETIDYPPAIYDSALTVGGTDATDEVSASSSRGPVTIDDSGRLKPDLAAPASDVRSAAGILDIYSGDVFYDYVAATGTSAAAPHVVGAAALLLDARPDLIGRVDEIENLLRSSALPLTAFQTCGGIPTTESPNNVFGHGRLDVLSVITGDADGDGVANVDDCSPSDPSLAAEPPAVEDLQLDGDEMLSWSPASPHPAASATYDVLRSTTPDFSTATCVVTAVTSLEAQDSAPSGTIYYYLVRLNNDCGVTAGQASDGTARHVPECPVAG